MKNRQKYKTQRETAKDNENRVIKALYPNPKTFTELKNELGISHTGLSKILDRLKGKDKGLIERVQYSKAYKLTANGNKTVKAIPIIKDNIDIILSEKHIYYNKIGKFSLGYNGISLDILRNANFNPKLAKIFEKMAEETFEKYESEIANIPNYVNDQLELKGKIILAFTIDFDDMKEQFRNRNNKFWEKFNIKWENEENWEKLFEGDETK